MSAIPGFVAALLLTPSALSGGVDPDSARRMLPPLPFEFALADEDVARFETADAIAPGGVAVPVVLRWTPARTGERVDLFQERPGRGVWPRWKWVGARISDEGRALLAAEKKVATLAVWRHAGSVGYEIGAAFRWPSERSEINLTHSSARTLRGEDPAAASAGPPRWISAGPPPQDDPLCETDGARKWQCLAVPAGRAGAVVSCGPRGERRSAAVDAAGAGDLLLEATDWAAPIAVEIPPGAGDSPGDPVSFWISVPGGGNGQIRDRTAMKAAPLGGNLYWIAGPIGPETRLSARISATRAGTLETVEIGAAPCGTPIPIVLAETGALRGRVLGASGAPLARASVLLLEPRPSGDRTAGSPPPALVASTLSDENGGWAFESLEPRLFRVRGCHAAAGCAEKEARPATEDLELVLVPRWRFTGRLLSRSGVPQAQAHLRFLPTLDQYANARDRLLTLPPETDGESDSEGHFEIAPAGPGAYYLEARALRVGSARRAVDITELSPSLTDLGDLVLSGAVELLAYLLGPGCSGGSLAFAGPVGATSMLSVHDFPLDARGAAHVELPEGGSWLTWARCANGRRDVEPNMLSHVEDLAGSEIRLSLRDGEASREDNLRPPR